MPRFKGYSKTKRALTKSARKKGVKDRGAYIYGTLAKIAKRKRRKRRK